MLTVGESIQRVQSLYSRGVQSQDSRLMPKHIWNKLTTARATLLSQKQSKGQSINQWNYQTIPCVELIPAAPYECPCIPPAGCMWLRSKYELPQPISGIGGDSVQSVSSLDGSIIFQRTDFATVKYLVGNKYTGKKPRYLFYNNYIFVIGTKQLKVVQVTELVADPEDAWNFPSYCSEFPQGNCEDPVNDCVDCCIAAMDRQFPLDMDATDTAIQMAANELISIFTQMKADESNNRQDNTATSNIVHQPRQD